MYQEAGLWDQALAVAHMHLPHRVSEVAAAGQGAAAARGVGGTKADFLGNGRLAEKSGGFSAAIDAYLAARKGLLGADELEEVWEQAVRVARKEVRGRYAEVVGEVARRLKEVGRHAGAAELLREAQQLDAAVDCAVEGECWAKARELASGSRPLEAKVERAYQAFLAAEGKTGELLERGHTNTALDVLAKAREWTKLWETATKVRRPPTQPTHHHHQNTPPS